MKVLQPDLFAQLVPWLRPAHRIELAPLSEVASPTADRYAGNPARPPGQSWPRCGACANPLAFVAQFHARGQRWRFFYCTECTPWSDADRRRGLCTLEHSAPDAPWEEQTPPIASPWSPQIWVAHPVLSPPLLEDEGLLDEKWPAAYRRWLVEQTQVEDPETEETARVFASWGAWAGSGTQLGGYPHPIQTAQRPLCEHCKREMPLLARLDSEEDVGLMWADLGAVYLHACPDHPDSVHFELQAY